MRALVVDDNEAFRVLVAVILREVADVVEQAADGEVGLRLAQTMRPDLIVMDITMPRMDGITAARRIREQQPEVHIVFLSGTETAEKLADASKEGVVLEKHVIDLRSQLLAAIESPPHATARYSA